MKKILALAFVIACTSLPARADRIFSGTIKMTVAIATTDGLPGIPGLSLGDVFWGTYQYMSPTVDFSFGPTSTVFPFHFQASVNGPVPSIPLVNLDGLFGLHRFTVAGGLVTEFEFDDQPSYHVHACLCGVSSSGSYPSPGSPYQISIDQDPSTGAPAAYAIVGSLAFGAPSAVPEPSSLLLVCGGIASLIATRRRSRR